MSSGGYQAQPTIIYGTAWKEEATERLVGKALDAGFRAIDTANQRKHYDEAGVGRAVKGALEDGVVRREELFLQTKFTSRDGQDHRLPYDPDAPIATQVAQSVASSLDHLGVTYLDALLLHGPSRREGLGPEDLEAWDAMEAAHRAGRARTIGLSNVSPLQLEAIWTRAKVKPTHVQNRTFTRPQADRAVRDFCGTHGMFYQGFSLLTAIRSALHNPAVTSISQRLNKTPEQVVLRYALQAGIVPLTGTKSPTHMADDLALTGFMLEPAQFQAVERLVS
jgi:diketogulonate reductase-like aldo/keto reductase